MTRLARDWRALTADQHLAGGAAVALFATMLLPWYQQNAVVNATRGAPLLSRNLNAFQVFSFVEAAVLLVAVAVGYLLFARAEGRDFRLPGSDGAVVMAAGGWTALLLVVRLFDKPGISSHGIAANVGVQWGIFFALAAAGLMIYSGSRMRGARHPEPPLERTSAREAAERAPPPEPAERVREQPRPRHPPAPANPRQAPARRRVGAVEPTEQLSLEDPPREPD